MKPANLLLDRDGNVHVSDFGIASASGADMLTAPGTVLGTAGYISPEQARGEPATSASDRYALAVVAFELLTGRRPFGGDTPTTEAFAHVNASVPRVGEVDPTLPLALDSVFDSALAKDPSAAARDRARARPPAARGARRRARDGGGTHEGPAARAAGGAARAGLVRREHHARRRRGRLAALVALVLLGLGLGVAALVTAGDDFPPPQTRSAQDARSLGGGVDASTPQETTTAEPQVDGAALNRDGFARMQAGDFAGALPLLREAVLALKGSNTLDEAYASYNLAYSRFAVGRCDGVVGLLDRSERIQGHRSEIDELRRQWEQRCAPGEDGGGRAARQRRGKAKGPPQGRRRGRLGESRSAAPRSPRPRGSGPRSCFENTRRPSAKTSNWPRPPGVTVASIPSVSPSSAARLAARSSYPLQVGQKKISTATRRTLVTVAATRCPATARSVLRSS